MNRIGAIVAMSWLAGLSAFAAPVSAKQAEAPVAPTERIEQVERTRWTSPVLRIGQGYTLKAGDAVVITGAPGRDVTEHRMRMASLRRTADGFGWGNKPGEKFD